MVSRRAAANAPVLTVRELNRATLARQMLLRRERLSPARAIERLGALQAQWAPAPYVALWSRLEGFTIVALERALHARRVVKATLMRGTLHLVSAQDYAMFASAVPEARRSTWASTERTLLRYFANQSAEARRAAEAGRGLGDTARMRARLLRYARQPRSREALAAFMAEQAELPLELAQHLVWGFIAAHGGLVHVPPSGTWRHRLAGEQIAATEWLGAGAAETSFEDAVLGVVRRHLAAFGPASVDDISSWTSIRTPPVRVALASLGRRVRAFRDENGRALYDLVAAPRPPAETAAPVRYLAKWDSPLLAYTPADRMRVLPETYRKAVIGKNGDVAQTFLLDGMVAGTWEVRLRRAEAVLTLSPFRRLAAVERAGLEDEGVRLARFVEPHARAHHVRV